MDSTEHKHQHSPNRFAVIPTPVRLNANLEYTGKGVTIAFLDSGFYPHPDLLETSNRVVGYEDLAGERRDLSNDPIEAWQWHGTQTSVVAAGDGRLSDGVYRGLAHEAELVLVKVSARGRITEENIARGIQWVIANRRRYNIRVLNISLGGDEDVPCSRSIIDHAAEEAISAGIVVVAAAGNSGNEGRHSIPPANSPSVITVGGYSDNNQPGGDTLDLYHSNFGVTTDGTVKPEIVAPAMWVAAPILPGTAFYEQAEALSQLLAAPDYLLAQLAREKSLVPEQELNAGPDAIRRFVEASLNRQKIVAAHYQHVDGTSFAAPIVTSIVAQMLQANPRLTPHAIKNMLISTADRIPSVPAIRQGYGVVNASRAVESARTEQHALNGSGYSSPRVANGRLVFTFHDDVATSVSVAGDFNGWDQRATPLQRNKTGLWSTEILVPRAGQFQYKFIVDGRRWIEDPANGMKAPDNYGGLNSLLVIE